MPTDRIHQPRSNSHAPHFRNSNSSVYLEITRGRARHRVRPIPTAVFLVGKASDCDLVLGDTQFPEVHFYLFREPDQVSLRHLGTRPELTVNGRVARSTSLHDRDRIRTGPYEFTVRIPDQARPAIKPLTLTTTYAADADPSNRA